MRSTVASHFLILLDKLEVISIQSFLLSYKGLVDNDIKICLHENDQIIILYFDL